MFEIIPKLGKILHHWYLELFGLDMEAIPVLAIAVGLAANI